MGQVTLFKNIQMQVSGKAQLKQQDSTSTPNTQRTPGKKTLNEETAQSMMLNCNFIQQ
ncbi:MAG: hypothetical protein ACJAZ4_002451 [Neptuniibacter pectenicola]|jgi:hypothetical protein